MGSGMETGGTEYPCFLWVNQFDTLGFGKDTVIVAGTSPDSMLIIDPKKERFYTLRRLPDPFYTRGVDGRMVDAKVSWNGQGIWATDSVYIPEFTEARLDSANQVQLCPNPSAN